MNLSLSTIILFVHQIDQQKKFYRDVFQLEVVEEYATWVLLKTPSCYLGLHQIPEEYLGDDPNEQVDNNVKLVFDVLDLPLQQFHDQLIQQGVRMQSITTFDNYPFDLCDGKDPEGNVFQLRQRKHA